MHYRVIRDCIIKGARAKAGTVIALDQKIANEMMAIGRVIPETAMPNTSDRQVKEVQTHGRSKTAAKKQPRGKGTGRVSSGRNSTSSDHSESSDS